MYGNSIYELMDWCSNQKDNVVLYFHNLKFDGEFIIHWLFNNGFYHVTERTAIKDNTFTTLISDKGVFYEIEIIFRAFKTRLHHVIFRDSLKVLPMTVDQVAKAFNLPIRKLHIDYDEYRAPGHELTEEEGIVCKNFYFSYPKFGDINELEYFHNTTGEWDPEASEKVDMTFEQLEEIRKELAARTVALDAESFSEIGKK